MKKLLQFLFVVSVVSAATLLTAQETPKKDAPEAHSHKFYKVSFLIYELEDGKKINERTYNFPVSTDNGIGRRSSMRVGTRVPVVTKETQVQYLDVGLDLSCDVNELADKLLVNSSVEITSFALPEQAADPRSGGNPVFRNIRQNFTTVVTPGKPALVTTMDDVNSKKRMQVEVTATRIE